MNDTDAKLLLTDIINKAIEGRAHPFRTIRYWSEYRYYWRWIKSTRLIIKTLKLSADSLFLEYCEDVIAGVSDVMKLFAYQQLLDIITFYETDLATVKAMVDDYDNYLGEGNFLYSVLGGRRDN